MNWYNEIDKYAAQWLRNLIEAGLIADGVVDERSIEDIHPNELRQYTQCHFFAGIGIWSLALRRAGWPDTRRVWTGSCPCQPFSAAGQGAGFDDERHLWPAFQHLIRECEPPAVFGEQVASADAAPWLDLVQTDLEGLGYAFGAVPFPSASVGAPHIRDRNFWVAYADLGAGGQGSADIRGWVAGGDAQAWTGSGGSGMLGGMEHTGFDNDASESGSTSAGQSQADRSADQLGRSGVSFGGLADAQHNGCDRPGGLAPLARCDESNERVFDRDRAALRLVNPDAGVVELARPGPVNGFWSDADWLRCRDGKWRPVESGTFPLAHGDSNRVGRLRAYGNCINAEAAEVFIRSALSATHE